MRAGVWRISAGLVLCNLFGVAPAVAGVLVESPIGPMEGSKSLTPSPTPVFPEKSVLPPLEERDPDQLSHQKKVLIHQIELEGNTVLKGDDLEELLSFCRGREMSIDELIALKDKVSLWYIQHGYVNSGAILPDQEIIDGVIRMRVIEGRLGEIQVRDNQHLKADFIKRHLEGEAGDLLFIPKLEERFQLLKQAEMIENIHSEMRPGPTPGEAVLDVAVEERSPYRFWVGANNQGAQSTGGNRLVTGAAHNSLFGWGDVLRGEYAQTSGAQDYAFSYSFPFGKQDTTLTLSTSQSTSSVVVAPFNNLDISNRQQIHEITLRHPFIRTIGEEVAASLSLQRKETKTFLLGEPFAFTPGSDDGHTKVHTLGLGGEWSMRDAEQALTLMTTLHRGLDIGDSTVRPVGEPDGRFYAWLTQAQLIRRVPWQESQLTVHAALRLTSDSMLASEKFALGGLNTVRGYREGLLSRDMGWVTNAEWRIPTPLRLSLSDNKTDGLLSGLVFGDYGQNWDKGVRTTENKYLSSIGLGVLWEINRNSSAAIYLANPLQDVAVTEKDLPDRGIHFRFSFQP
ncbi:MAG: ShlB/FhaC/HecB family hemolysin secretion/activation protein [Magnetococcales bacterium]|nr:ShlB/FhaC/HecB family hemolysin secretion/activation protein [Magnetococcales bacterium]